MQARRPRPAGVSEGLVKTWRIAECSLLVAISAHYVPARLPYLLEVVRALADINAQRLDIHVMVNEVDDETAARLHRLLSAALPAGRTVTINRVGGLDHPFDLTWAHKRLIPEVFLAEGSAFTHFLYLEDDMRFGAANLRYFLRFRPLLEPFGLLPSFLRIEYSAAAEELRFTEHRRPTDPASARGVTAGGVRFIATPPYCALYVLDRPLARQHVESPSFDREASKALSRWAVRERAAAGVCWDRVPRGFRRRYVVPLAPDGTGFAPECLVPHLHATYADNPTASFAKIPVHRAFDGPDGT
jgi:hypothetical protein